jgi:hypothetical protein
LLASSLTGGAQGVRALEYQVEGFVAKPFELKDFLGTVERVLQ